MKKKRNLLNQMLCLALCFSMVLSYAPMIVSAEETAVSGECGDQATWNYDAETKTLTISGTGPMKDYLGSEVTPWDVYANDITTIVIGEGVTRIGNSSFNNMTALTSISISETVAVLGQYAIYNCDALESLCIPGSIKRITKYSVVGCSRLQNLTLLEGVEEIGGSAITDCSVESVTIPSSVVSVSPSAFSYNPLQSIAVAENNQHYYAEDGVLFTKDKKLVIYPEAKTGTSYTVPEGTIGIGEEAFMSSQNLESVELPNTVTYIGKKAFLGCRQLWEINIPSSVKSIGDSAFENCSGLTQINISYGVTSIGTNAFCGCSFLTEIEIPGSVTSIGQGAFWFCSGLTQVTIPNSVTDIASDAFEDCNYIEYVYAPCRWKEYDDYPCDFPSNPYIYISEHTGSDSGEGTCLGKLCVACNLFYEEDVNPDNHATDDTDIRRIDDEYHGVYRSCCGVLVETEPHDHTNGKCVCGEKITPIVTVTFATPTYTGSAQNLVLEGMTSGGELQYSTNGIEWSTTIPTATWAGTYDIFYRVVGDENYKDVEKQFNEVTIVKADISYTAPIAKELVYTGDAQELITEGSANAGTIWYALGGNDSTVPEDNWSVDIPTGTLAGSYYVWHKVTGGGNHKDLPPTCLLVQMKKATPKVTVQYSSELVYNGLEQELFAIDTEGCSVEFSLDGETWSEVIPTKTHVGEYEIRCRVVGDANYANEATISSVVDGVSSDFRGETFTVSVNIATARPVISWANTTVSVNYTGSAVVIDAPTVTLVNGEVFQGEIGYSYTGTSRGEEVSGNGLPTNVGTYQITAHVSAQGDYSAAVSDQTVSLAIVDRTAPSGSISIKEDSWTQFWDWMTFGHFFDEKITVTVTADGTGSDVAKVEYLLSGETLAEESMPTEGWNTLAANNGKYSFSIEPKNKAAVYVRITDEGGNVAILNSDGIVVYADSVIAQPVIEYVYKENQNRVLTITTNGNGFAKLTDSTGEEIDSQYYTEEDGVLTLKAEYLDTLNKGEYTYKVLMNPMGVETQAVTLEYSFTIKVAAKTLTVTSVVATNRPFDGTSTVAITDVVLDGKADGDNVSIDVGNLKGTLSGMNADTYTAVTLPVLTLTGSQAGNYTLVQPQGAVSTEVIISKADAEITLGVNSYDKTYKDADFLLDVTDTNTELDARYEVISGDTVVSVANGKVTLLSAGTATIKVSVPESTNYNACESKTITITVAKAENVPNMPGNTMNVSYVNKTVGAVTLPTGWIWQDADKNTQLEVGVSVNATAVYEGADKGSFENTTAVITLTRLACAHTNTEVRGAYEATCERTGYTGDTYCRDCGERRATGVATSVKDHSGGTATCTKKAVCSMCGKEYGALDSNKHGETKVKGAIAATCTSKGYTGDTLCKDCGVRIASGVKTDKLDHTYKSKVTKEATTQEEGEMTYTCTACGESYTKPIDKLKVEEPAKPTGKEEEVPETKDAWDAIRDVVKEAKDGEDVNVSMNSATVVPGDVFDGIKGQDVTIVFDMGNGITWKVNGKDITEENIGDIDFAVKVGEEAKDTIPVDVINKVSGERYSVNVSLAYEGEFGFEAVLTLNMDAQNAGLYANLFYYNEILKDLEFVCADKIDADGTAELTFNHASEYVIVLDIISMETAEFGDIDIPASAEVGHNWFIWCVLILGVLALVIVVATVLRVKRNKDFD